MSLTPSVEKYFSNTIDVFWSPPTHPLIHDFVELYNSKHHELEASLTFVNSPSYTSVLLVTAMTGKSKSSKNRLFASGSHTCALQWA